MTHIANSMEPDQIAPRFLLSDLIERKVATEWFIGWSMALAYSESTA